jgi:signal transduction histidine kinase
MLAFSRRQPLEEVDVNTVIEDMTRQLGHTLAENISVKVQLQADLPAALVDASQLETALLNIAINARDAMANGGTLTIATSLAELDADYVARHPGVAAGTYVVIEMEDSGTGISQEVIDRMFEPFFTTKPSGKGTGLGLSVVYGFVRQSGGHIRVYSEMGQGTAFQLHLPVANRDRGSIPKYRSSALKHNGGERVPVLAFGR